MDYISSIKLNFLMKSLLKNAKRLNIAHLITTKKDCSSTSKIKLKILYNFIYNNN